MLLFLAAGSQHEWIEQRNMHASMRTSDAYLETQERELPLFTFAEYRLFVERWQANTEICTFMFCVLFTHHALGLYIDWMSEETSLSLGTLLRCTRQGRDRAFSLIVFYFKARINWIILQWHSIKNENVCALEYINININKLKRDYRYVYVTQIRVVCMMQANVLQIDVTQIGH